MARGGEGRCARGGDIGRMQRFRRREVECYDTKPDQRVVRFETVDTFPRGGRFASFLLPLSFLLYSLSPPLFLSAILHSILSEEGHCCRGISHAATPRRR